MIKLIKRLYAMDVVRYVFFGGCTTLLNLVSFYVLRQMGVPRDPANITSIILAILFAYVVNSRFVFQESCETWKDHMKSLGKFISARGVTMFIEIGGVWFFSEVIHINDFLGKFITQFVVLVLNYIFSKFLVFTGGRKK